MLYGALADRAVFEGGGKVRDGALWRDRTPPSRLFLVLLFAGLVLLQVSSPGHASEAETKIPSAADMIAGIVFSEVIFVALAAGPLLGMKLRGMSLREAFGVGRLGRRAQCSWGRSCCWCWRSR